MSADLFRIRYSGQAQALLARVNQLSPALGKMVEARAQNVLNQAGELAHAAARSTVPIDGGQLRADVQLSQPASVNEEAIVFVDPVDHRNRRGQSFYRRGGESNPKTNVIGSPALADLLNHGRSHTGKAFKRSRPSLAESGFNSLSGKTEGWEDAAREQFLAQLKRMLASGR